ncbi:MAG: hypothetical protein WA268_17500 [Xanthobacteraceae bacterium]
MVRTAFARCINLLQVIGSDELLQQGNVRVVRLIQRKALRERPEQSSVGILRVLYHRRVGFERDVDCCHRILLRDGPLGKHERQHQPEANGREDERAWTSRVAVDAG